MRAPGLVVLAIGWLAIGWLGLAGAGIAQERPNQLSEQQGGIGKLDSRIQKYDQALGVITTLRRPPSQLKNLPPPNLECDGICFFANGSKPVAWQCASEQRCDLHCTVNPPVGGCK